jgi:hypothetical protein
MKASKLVTIPIEVLKQVGIWLLKNASWIVPSVVGAVKNTISLFKKKKKPQSVNNHLKTKRK